MGGAMPPSPKIIELRELLAAKYPTAPQRTTGCLPTEIAAVDAALQGGLPFGGMTEVVGQTSSGLLLTALIHATQRRRGLLALIDGGNAFDLAGMPKAALSRLLWVRSPTAAKAIQAADLILRDGNLSLVVLDLRSIPNEETRKVPASSWYRLQRVVEPTATAFVVLTCQPLVSGARPRLELTARFGLNAFDCRQKELLGRLHVELVRGQEERVQQIA